MKTKKVLGTIIVTALLVGSLVTEIIRIMHELQVGLLIAIGITTIEILIIVLVAAILAVAINWLFNE